MMPYDVLRFINLKVFIIGFITLYSHSVLLDIKCRVQVINITESCEGGPGKPRFSVSTKNTTIKKAPSN